MGKAAISDDFDRYFSVRIARTSTEKDEVYAIRYRVYCEEFGYEDPDAFPDRLERDDVDDFSQHCLIYHRPSGLPAACVRLVPADQDDRNLLLPLEKHCAGSLDPEYAARLQGPREHICEISRLAVDAGFRRRAGESATRYGRVQLDFSPAEQRMLPFIAVSAYLAATALTELADRRNVFAMMEPFLPRLMGRAGIHFSKAGCDVNYHGMRAPYFITTESALRHMVPELRELYRIIRAQIPEVPRSESPGNLLRQGLSSIRRLALREGFPGKMGLLNAHP